MLVFLVKCFDFFGNVFAHFFIQFFYFVLLLEQSNVHRRNDKGPKHAKCLLDFKNAIVVNYGIGRTQVLNYSAEHKASLLYLSLYVDVVTGPLLNFDQFQ